MFAARRRLRRQNDELCLLAERKTCIRYGVTLRCTLLTIFLALPWPAATAFVAWRLSSNSVELPRAIASALWIQALIFFPVELVRQMCRPNGLAVSHFDWPRSAAHSLRTSLTVLMACVMPLVLLISTLYVSSGDHGNDTFGRILFVTASLIVAAFFGYVLRPGGGFLHEYIGYHRDGWVERSADVWRWVGVGIPLALALVTFFGYYYTAIQLTGRLYFSALYVMFLVVLRSLLLRLLLVHRRDLSMRQARERRAAALAAQEELSSSEGDLPGTAAALVETVNLAQLSIQTQRLLTTGAVVGSLIALWCIWVDVIPALSLTDRWPLWTSVATVTETTTDAAGQTQVITREILKTITLSDLLLAFLIGGVTLVASRNIPGLLEISILQRLPLEASMRYALTTIASYAIIMLGVVIACSTIGLRWSQIQWLATALTFGLAFGLQEVFANLVAGLIILFERPIRVGDVVTVGDVSGVVSRMRIRATTITDWDRKELIVPNKEFITGRLLNWTLSDKMNRIVIEVGLAYGSDTEKARLLLQQIAKDQPLVLDTPPPMAAFEGFGDHALKLVLRAHLGSLDNRLQVIHELHTAIHKQFAECGLEIAFPQLDLHIRPRDSAGISRETTPATPDHGVSKAA